MSIRFKMILVLTIIGILSGGVLSWVYQGMYPQIEAQKEKQLREAILIILPGASGYETQQRGENVVYCGLNDRGECIGYAIPASGNGYQGKIDIIMGVNVTLDKLYGIEVLNNVETPGLGAKITDKDFLKQFKGLKLFPFVEYIKNVKPSKSNQIQAITGATISTRALIKIINEKIEGLRTKGR